MNKDRIKVSFDGKSHHNKCVCKKCWAAVKDRLFNCLFKPLIENVTCLDPRRIQ